MTQELKVLVGIPASGKSTWARFDQANQEEEGKTCAIISRDLIRKGMLKEGDEYFAKEGEVFKTYIDELNACLEAGINVVYADATHLNEASRRKLLSRLKPDSRTHLTFVIFDPALAICLERNSRRKGFAQVPDNVICRMSKSFTYPDEDEIPPSNYGFAGVKFELYL